MLELLPPTFYADNVFTRHLLALFLLIILEAIKMFQFAPCKKKTIVIFSIRIFKIITNSRLMFIENYVKMHLNKILPSCL
jgi:hypothetical protein